MAEPPEADLATDAVAEDHVEGAGVPAEGATPAQPEAAAAAKPKTRAESGKAQASPKTQDKKFNCEPKLQVLKKLGEGYYGSVYLVKGTLEEKKYAVKEIKFSGNTGQALEEVKALAALEHKGDFGIVELYHPWIDTTVTEDEGTEVPTLCYKMELCGKTLAWWLDKYKEPKNRDRMKMLGVFYQLVATVAYIHQKKGKEKRGFIHRDLKPDNIFMPDKGKVEIKVGDFGLAIDKDMKIQGKRKGNPRPYAAPELYSNPTACSEKVDIFSLGTILLVLLVSFGSPEERTTALMKAREGDFSQFQRHCQPKDLELAQLLCARDPQRRPSAAEVMTSNHCQDFMKQVDGRSDVLAQCALCRIKKYACWKQDLQPDLKHLPDELKKRFYDGIIIHHEDEEKEAKEYKEKIQALTLKDGSHPVIALPRDVRDAGATETENAIEIMKVCSIVYFLVTVEFCKAKTKDGQFVSDMYITESKMYPSDKRENFVVPVFTKKKTDLANFLRPDVKALSGIKCHREFDGESFVKSLTDCPYEHSRHCREEGQKLQQDAYLVHKQIEDLKL